MFFRCYILFELRVNFVMTIYWHHEILLIPIQTGLKRQAYIERQVLLPLSMFSFRTQDQVITIAHVELKLAKQTFLPNNFVL